MSLEYVVHPARRSPARALFIALFCFLVCLLVALAAGWGSFVLSAAVLLHTTSPFFLPTRVSIDDEGVSLRRLGLLRKRRWIDLRRFAIAKDAVLLSTSPTPTWLDHTRGLVVVFADHRDEVMKIVRERMPSQWSR